VPDVAGQQIRLFKAGTEDVGWFLVAWTLFTAILWVGSLRIHGAMAFTFTTLLIGFILLDLAHFGYPSLTVVAGYELMVCALAAWYMMARHHPERDLRQGTFCPGKPWVS
jgi:succinate-acetate transporter protein